MAIQTFKTVHEHLYRNHGLYSTPPNETIGPVTRCDEMSHFRAISQTIAGDFQNMQQCGQSAAHDGIFLYSPALRIAAMVVINIQLGFLVRKFIW